MKDLAPFGRNLVPNKFSSSWKWINQFGNWLYKQNRCVLSRPFFSTILRLQYLICLVSVKCFILCVWSIKCTCVTVKLLCVIRFSKYSPQYLPKSREKNHLEEAGIIPGFSGDGHRMIREKHFLSSGLEVLILISLALFQDKTSVCYLFQNQQTILKLSQHWIAAGMQWDCAFLQHN